MRLGNLSGRLRAGASTQPFYHEGIHLDFRQGLTRGHYTKVAAAQPTIAAFTTLFTFTGGNQSYVMGRAGLLVPSVTNTPRLEYASGEVLGLLIEAARTNLALHSADGTNAAWVKLLCTAAKTATGPDGVASSATTLTATDANATALQTVVSVSATRTLSVWLKRRTGSGNVDIAVDGTTWTNQAITSSWARYTLTQAAVTNPVFGIRIVTSGDEVDFWGAQVESAAFASSAIPTTTLAVARTADVASRALGSEFSATAGTVVVRGRASAGQDAALSQMTWAIDDGTANERLWLQRYPASTNMRFITVDGGVAQASLDVAIANNQTFRAASAWAANDVAHSYNGAAVLTDTAGTLPTVTTLALGHSTAVASGMNGHILTFDYWPVRQPNNFLVTV